MTSAPPAATPAVPSSARTLPGLPGRTSQRPLGSPPGTSLVLHWGGPRHGEVDEVPREQLVSSVLVYDGPRWFGVYQRFEPVHVRATPSGPAEVWVVRE
jgi:hypothetical protein